MDAFGSVEESAVDRTTSQQSNNVNHHIGEESIVKLLHHTELVEPSKNTQEDTNTDDNSHVKGENDDNNKHQDNNVVLRNEAWIHVIEPMSDVQSSIFEFVPPSTSRDSSITIPVIPGGSARNESVNREKKVALSRPKKRVSFAPEVGDDNTLAHDHVLLIDDSERSGVLSAVEQSRQLERSYVVQTIFRRLDVFDVQANQQNRQQSRITATQISVLASAGLAFSTSTRSLVVQQGILPPPPSKPAKRKLKRRRSRKAARLGFTRITARLRHRVTKVSERVPSKPVNSTRPVRLKVKLKVKLKHNRKTKSNDDGDSGENTKVTKVKKIVTGSNKNKIGSYGAIAVFQALRVNRALLSLSLEHVGIDDSAMSALAAALRVNTSLTHLSLAGNRISSIGARDLADALEDSPDSMLIDLDLRDNQLGAHGVDEIGRALRENETLTRCDLSWNQIGPKAVLSLLSALRDNFALRELCVYGRDLAEGGTRYLSNLDFDSAKRIVVALRHLNDSFAVVRLSGARAILPIDKVKGSRWIHLANRELTELDGLVVAGLIPQNSMLLSLDLHDNPGLGRAAVLGLLSAIKCTRTLRDVNLSNTGLYPEAGESVGELVALNSTLGTIKMHETSITIQQVRGNQRAGDVPETMTFFVDPKHFLDRWIIAKCFAVNRLTQELNELRLPVASNSSKKTVAVGLAANQKDRRDMITVSISGRPLEVYEVAFLGKKMLHHLHLGRVALNSCMLDGAAARALADGVRNHSTLHSLELENNPLGPIGGQALSECLASSSALTYLNLSWTQLGDDGVIGFREALMRNKSIERLDLRGNELRVRGVVAIAEGLRRTATLRELHLRWNSVSPAGAEALAVALEINQSLRLLDIEHHTMGSRGAAAFASMLTRNKHLEHLNMGGTDSDDALDAGPGISSDQAQRIAEALANSNRSLQVLHIGANRIDVDAVARFGELLKFNNSLVALDLSRSGLDANKSPRFFACLSVNNKLERLNLAHNRIGNEGLVACTRALETNRTLRELNLAYNGITEEPLAVLAAKLHSPKRQITASLEWLCLTGNNMTEHTRRAYRTLSQNTIAIELQDNDEIEE